MYSVARWKHHFELFTSPRRWYAASLSDCQQNCLACAGDRSDRCNRHGKPWERENLHEDVYDRRAEQHHSFRYPQSEMHGGGPPRLESYSIDKCGRITPILV